jgi:hypothetical protein
MSESARRSSMVSALLYAMAYSFRLGVRAVTARQFDSASARWYRSVSLSDTDR